MIGEKVRCPMGVCGVPDSCSGSAENETCDTAADRPQWVLLVVRLNHERKVAEGLQAKGYEVFLPMHTVQRQWSDRVKTYDAPLFPGQPFCRRHPLPAVLAQEVHPAGDHYAGFVAARLQLGRAAQGASHDVGADDSREQLDDDRVVRARRAAWERGEDAADGARVSLPGVS